MTDSSEKWEASAFSPMRSFYHLCTLNGLRVIFSGLVLTAAISWFLGRFAFVLSQMEVEQQGFTVEVTSEPPGAMVFVDDQYVGLSPLETPGLKEGLHLIRFEKHDHKSRVQPIEVTRHNAQVTTMLKRLPSARIFVSASPAGEVKVDGRECGETPLELEVRAGLHKIEVIGEGYLSWERQVDAKGGERVELEAKLKSRLEEFLLERVAEEPWRVAFVYELAHHYLVGGDFDRALELIEQGLRSTYDPRCPTGEASRLIQEIDNFWTGQFNFGTAEKRTAMQPKLVALCERVFKEQPRNVAAVYELGVLYQRLGRGDEMLNVYQTAYRSFKTERARRYIAHEIISKNDMARASALLTEAHRLRKEYVRLQGLTDKPPAKVQEKLGSTLESLKKQAAAAKVKMEAKYRDTIESYEAGAKLFPSLEIAKNCLTQVASIYQTYLPDQAKYIETLRRIIKQFPLAGVAHGYQKNIADHFYSKGLYHQAAEEYRTYLKQYADRDNSPSVTFLLAQCQLSLKDAKGAVATLESILENYPDSPENPTVMSKLLSHYQAGGNHKKAANVLSRLLSEYAHTPFAEQLETNKNRKKQRARAKASLAAIQTEIARLTQQRERYSSLISKANSLKTSRDHKAAVLAEKEVKGALRLLMAGAQKALDSLSGLVAGFPWSVEARSAQLEMVNVYTNVLIDKEKARAAMRRFIELFPKDSRSPEQILTNAAALLGEKDKKGAVQEYERFLTDYPERDDCASVYWRLVGVYGGFRGREDRKKYEDALNAFVARYPNDDLASQALHTLAMIYYYRSFPGDRELSIKAMSRMEKDYPNANYTLTIERYRARLDAGMQPAESQAGD